MAILESTSRATISSGTPGRIFRDRRADVRTSERKPTTISFETALRITLRTLRFRRPSSRRSARSSRSGPDTLE